MSTISPEDQKMFDEYRDLFLTPGWIRMVDDLSETVEGLDTVNGLDSLYELGKRQGKIEAYLEITTLEEYIKRLEEEYEIRD